MANDAKLGNVPRHLSKHLTNINEGGETGVASDHEALPQLAAKSQKLKVQEAIDRIRSMRRKNGRATVAEILQWRDEGRK
jgi:hypothetical protein